MNPQKRALLTIASKIQANEAVKPKEISALLAFTNTVEERKWIDFLKRSAVPASLLLGFLFAVYPRYVAHITSRMPSWTNLSPQLLNGVDYWWDIIGDPIGKANILYHIPNIVLYSFGIIGVKTLLESLDRRNWLNQLFTAQQTLRDHLARGSTNLLMRRGSSLLFVGKGDFVGMQFVLNHRDNETVTISQCKPSYTDYWNYYDVDTLYDDLKRVMIHSSGATAGEYIFFPVKDDQIFLPGEKSYDLSPHKLDILCQNIRTIEKEYGWKSKRIIIVGDRFHKSFVQSEDQDAVIPDSEDTISLSSIAKKYEYVSLLDPTDIVLTEILRIARGRRIVFRATKEGIAEYKTRFYDRLKLLDYHPVAKDTGILTIGYDIFEDQTEQQTLSRKIDDYYPVVLSKNVHDALLRNGYKKDEFLYVPELVLRALSQAASEQ